MKVLTGQLWRDPEGWLYLETVSGDRYPLIEPQTITFTENREKVNTNELQDYHYGQSIIAQCKIRSNIK